MDNFDPNVDLKPEALREALYTQMKTSKHPHFQNDLAHYGREESARTYECFDVFDGAVH